jgi:hypothetical protein
MGIIALSCFIDFKCVVKKLANSNQGDTLLSNDNPFNSFTGMLQWCIDSSGDETCFYISGYSSFILGDYVDYHSISGKQITQKITEE